MSIGMAAGPGKRGTANIVFQGSGNGVLSIVRFRTYFVRCIYIERKTFLLP